MRSRKGLRINWIQQGKENPRDKMKQEKWQKGAI